MSSKTLESNRETPMTSHPQSGLLLQMSQPRGSKTKEEEEYEDAQGQQGLQGHGKKMASSKQPSTKNGRHERIVKVQGGHIVRSIARKDRHSKVYTSKGSRDRRFRLSAPTAIQFYDVQDRLGYERPSKAIDWLMKKAKASIDALDESSKTQKPMLQHQGRHSEPETVENHQQFGPSNMNNLSKEPVLDYGEGALNSACYFSEANFLETGWLQSLMAWNHNAGDAGEGCSFNSSHVSLNS